MALWEDPYRGFVNGERCPSIFEGARCMGEDGHDAAHRWTSSADGRSVVWNDTQDAMDVYVEVVPDSA